MFCYKQTILYITLLFNIGLGNILKPLVVGEGVEGVIDYTRNATIDWDGRRLKKARRYHPKSAVIKNDVTWYDHEGKRIKANRCGTISHKKINGYWYMVGSEGHTHFYQGGDIYLYKSATLGSESWRRVKKIHNFMPDSGVTSASCEISQRYDDPNIVILHCRLKVFISYTGIEGDYTMHILKIPGLKDARGRLRIGGSSTYHEGKEVYFVTSGLWISIDEERTRSLYIFKFNSGWTDIDENFSTISWKWDNHESPLITKRGKWYYIFSSRTHGWKQSKTYYRRAMTLKELANATTSLVVFHPANTPEIKSMGSQFCFMQKFDAGRWMFGGRRHPLEAPDIFADEYGTNVMAPAKFISGVPHVYWKYSFDWTKYNYRKPSNDSHNHYGHGHESIPCVESTGRFWIQFSQRNEGKRDCGWLDTLKSHRRRIVCDKHRELKIKCPLSCKSFGCKKN